MVKTKTLCIRISDSFFVLKIFFKSILLPIFTMQQDKKVSKIVNENSTITQTNYLAGGFQYKNNY